MSYWTYLGCYISRAQHRTPDRHTGHYFWMELDEIGLSLKTCIMELKGLNNCWYTLYIGKIVKD